MNASKYVIVVQMSKTNFVIKTIGPFENVDEAEKWINDNHKDEKIIPKGCYWEITKIIEKEDAKNV